MRTLNSLVLVALALATTGCSSGAENARTAREAVVNAQSLDVGGRPSRCLPAGDTHLATGTSYDLRGDLRRRLLTPEADRAGIRVYTSGTDVNAYGQVVLYYANADNTCVLWSESISLQEYGQRLGLSPLGISPFYEGAGTTTPSTTPATQPTNDPVTSPAS